MVFISPTNRRRLVNSPTVLTQFIKQQHSGREQQQPRHHLPAREQELHANTDKNTTT